MDSIACREVQPATVLAHLPRFPVDDASLVSSPLDQAVREQTGTKCNAEYREPHASARGFAAHDRAILALCWGVALVRDDYQFCAMLAAVSGRRKRAPGTPAAAFGATFSAAARGAR